MDIQDAKRIKKEIEDEIADKLKWFEEETGLRVINANIYFPCTPETELLNKEPKLHFNITAIFK